MKDYNNIPFKNHAIDRLVKNTTPPPGMRSMKDEKNAEWQKHTTTPFVHGYQEQSSYTPKVESKKIMVYPNTKEEQTGRLNALEKEPVKNPLISRVIKSKVGREYEPKVRKRHMRP